MKDITIIIPIHQYDEKIDSYLKKAIESVNKCRKHYERGKLITRIVCPLDVMKKLDMKELASFDTEEILFTINNEEKTDFCTQINCAVNDVDTQFFSILEFDDTYTEKWFKMVSDYYEGNESVSVFLPINVIISEKDNVTAQFMNEIAWTGSFSNEIGFIDWDCLQDYTTFNLTGGVFNTADFKAAGGLKASIKAAFNYEFLLRVTKKDLKVFVVPKEGYVHTLGREGSLIEEYSNTLEMEEIVKWFDLARIEYVFTEDRNQTIQHIKKEVLK